MSSIFFFINPKKSKTRQRVKNHPLQKLIVIKKN
jgi:hypothetical protein